MIDADVFLLKMLGAMAYTFGDVKLATEIEAMISTKSKKAPEPVLVVEREPDYWSRGHFYEGSKPYIDAMKVWSLPIGTKLYTHPTQLPEVIAQPAVPDGWMPIESAPKDGTPVLLCATRHSRVFPEPEVVVGRYERGWWSGRDPLSFVTNWKPCPALAATPEESP